jgi:dephospho-CoA kinase
MNIFGFTGMPCSGKSEAVKIAKEKGIPVYRMGDFVWKEVKKRNLSLNAENVGKVAQEMRKKYGNTVWAEKTVNEILQNQQTSIIVIDGIRSIEEAQFFRLHLSASFKLVAITAPDGQRHKRAKQRKRADDSIIDRDMQKRDERERGWGLEQVISEADITIDNGSSLKSFREKIHALFSDELIL